MLSRRNRNRKSSPRTAFSATIPVDNSAGWFFPSRPFLGVRGYSDAVTPSLPAEYPDPARQTGILVPEAKLPRQRLEIGFLFLR